MNFAQAQQQGAGGSRYAGLVMVAGIHVIIIWALASGLASKMVEAVKGPIEVSVVEEKLKPPPPPEKVAPPPPDMKAPPPPFMPPPEVQVAAPPPPNAIQAPVSNTPPPVREVAPTPPQPAAPAPPQPAATASGWSGEGLGMVCTKMGKPDVAGCQLEWRGHAYKALATVKAGRVVSVESDADARWR